MAAAGRSASDRAAAGGRLSLALAATPRPFDHECTVEPGQTESYQYPLRVDGPRILRRGEPRAERPPDTRLERRDPQVAPLVGVAAVPVQEQVHAPVAQIALAVKKDDRPRVVGREDLRHRRQELSCGPPPG